MISHEGKYEKPFHQIELDIFLAKALFTKTEQGVQPFWPSQALQTNQIFTSSIGQIFEPKDFRPANYLPLPSGQGNKIPCANFFPN